MKFIFSREEKKAILDNPICSSTASLQELSWNYCHYLRQNGRLMQQDTENTILKILILVQSELVVNPFVDFKANEVSGLKFCFSQTFGHLKTGLNLMKTS